MARYLATISFVFLLSQATVSQNAKPIRISNTKFAATTTITTSTTSTTTTTTTPSPIINMDRNSAIIFPKDHVTENNQLSKIPLDLLLQLGSVHDEESFFKLVHNGSALYEGEHIDGRMSSPSARDGVVQAKAANCQPELQTVPLIENGDSSVLYYPTCTRIERCGGCCTSELLQCEPTKKEIVPMQVIKTQYASGNRMSFAGKETVMVDKHLSCKCQCKVKAGDCTSRQVYLPGACRCECNNLDDRRKCEAENQTRYWDSRECQCRCREDGYCSTGYYFNEDVCQCEPWLSRRSDASIRAILGEGGRGNDKIPIEESTSFRKQNLDKDKEDKPPPIAHFDIPNIFSMLNRRP